MSRTVYKFVLAWAGLSILAAQQSGVKKEATPREAVLSVCSLLQESQRFEGKTVTVQADIIGSQHAIVLQGTECGKGIYQLHQWGQKGKTWESFDEALARESSGLDTRILRVTIRGVFFGGDARESGNPRLIKVTKVLSVAFAEGKQP